MYHSNAARMIPDDTVVQMEYVCGVSCDLRTLLALTSFCALYSLMTPKSWPLAW